MIFVVSGYVAHRLLRSTYMRRTWDYLLKFYRLRPKSHEVLYRRGEESFLPFRRPARPNRL